ncbi:MAG: NeuD/PglB/VioB family sugar acetyltransferase [Vulcanococcus sp.]|jgi:sugar O-acyltransferase (sialic acid O-acetyltransferase NeuD family)|uniref:NeuD/PglB/VioB family sugar acetyltransferase n=1 Tax=Vulcanococcus sp. TaxID=2856995 RepID=UPI0025E92867|nr:NeuD/PglB/VioB family sugar acetyltransferase [Vulcanococcus sp.]MBW0180977.1 NeuD/PglB/VioB family sugar acetyltransferase [Vulcanococcus sp.]
MTEPLLLIGCGGHARSLIDVVESSGRWHVLGLVGLPRQVGEKVLGYPVLGSDQDLLCLRQQCAHALLAVGQIGLPSHRQRLAPKLKRLEFTMPVVISGRAHVSRHAQLGSGTSVGHGVIVNAGASVGNYCILNSNSLVEHDAVIGDYCHISTGALVNGGVKVGDGSFIGSGAVLREGLNLPLQTVISAGKRVMGWPMREERLQ